MITLVICLSLLAGSPAPALSNELLFDVIFRDKVVGTLKAERITEGDRVIYRNLSIVEFSLVKKIRMEYETEVIYVNGEMEKATVITRMNGKIRSVTETIRNDHGYDFLEDGKLSSRLYNPIEYSAIMMLFDEPAAIDSVYSEEAGCFFKINSYGNSSYGKINGRGKTSSYYYASRKLERIAIEGGLFNFEMISAQES